MQGLNKGSRLALKVVVLGSMLAMLGGCAVQGNVLTDTLAEPLNDAKTAKIDINAGYSNLTIEHLTGGEPLLAGGSLEYLDNQGIPVRSVTTFGDTAEFTLRATDTTQSGLLLPWQVCVASLEWQVHLNPAVTLDITAYSNGGNVSMNLASLTINRVAAETGGGNVGLVLPAGADNLDVIATTGGGNVTIELGNDTTGNSSIRAESGAGNVTASLPSGIAARIHATTGAGKVTVDAHFNQVDDDTYESADYDEVTNKVEITLKSGAGNVTVNVK